MALRHPQIHVSFFEPTTIERAFARVGLEPEHHGFVAGFDEIIRYKTVKNLPAAGLGRRQARAVAVGCTAHRPPLRRVHVSYRSQAQTEPGPTTSRIG